MSQELEPLSIESQRQVVGDEPCFEPVEREAARIQHWRLAARAVLNLVSADSHTGSMVTIRPEVRGRW